MIAVAVGFRLVARSVLGALLLFVATAAVAVVRDAQENFFDTTFGDFSEELENARDQGKKGIPIMFDLDGNLVAGYTRATRDAREFLWLGECVVDGAYGKTSFTRYKLERRKAVH